jgi:hypothetical protein
MSKTSDSRNCHDQATTNQQEKRKVYKPGPLRVAVLHAYYTTPR